jgi:phage tail-like protein
VAKFTVNTHRFDPYRNFKFRVKIDNRYVAGLNRCSALRRTTEVVTWREGGDPSLSRQLPGMTTYEPVTLEAGVTHDPTFEEFANLVHNFEGDAASSLKNFRKDIIIDVYNEAGVKVISYQLSRCWVSEYQALPDLDAGGNAVAIQQLKIAHEGWQRDPSVVEPAES